MYPEYKHCRTGGGARRSRNARWIDLAPVVLSVSAPGRTQPVDRGACDSRSPRVVSVVNLSGRQAWSRFGGRRSHAFVVVAADVLRLATASCSRAPLGRRQYQATLALPTRDLLVWHFRPVILSENRFQLLDEFTHAYERTLDVLQAHSESAPAQPNWYSLLPRPVVAEALHPRSVGPYYPGAKQRVIDRSQGAVE